MRFFQILFLLVCWSATILAEELSYSDLVDRLTNLERLAEPVVAGEMGASSTSYDRNSQYDASTKSYQNWSANKDGQGFIRKEGDGQVMVDLKGPGVIWRIWSAMPQEGVIRVYLDGQTKPVIDQSFGKFFDENEARFPGLVMTLSRGRNSFVPIPFAKSCKIVMEKGWGAYFHCTHTVFDEGTEIDSFSGFTPEVVSILKSASATSLQRGSSPYTDQLGTTKKKTLTLATGASESLEVTGAGALRVLRIKPLNLPEDRKAAEDVLRELTISLYWDGEKHPSVWAPLGDFFGTAPGLNPFRTLPTGCIDGCLYSYWYMPFSKGMRLVLQNEGKESRALEIEMGTVSLPQKTSDRLLRFCAAWHGDDFTGLDKTRYQQKDGDRWPDWPLLVTKGSGRYVGMSLHVWKFGGWWGEGDEKFFVDGEKFPSTLGTGSEDYIGYAWAANPPFITFECAWAACSRISPDAEEDTSVCRFHLCDDIPFSEGFEGFLEVMPNRDCRPALYDTCVYWYRDRRSKNPYSAIPLEQRRLERPDRDQKHIMPSTFEVQLPKPGQVEGESMKVLSVTSGRTWPQDMAGFGEGTWSYDSQLVWTNGTLGDVLELEFKVAEGGDYKMVAAFTKASDFGVFEISIDGKSLDRHFDLFAPSVSHTGEIPLGTFKLKAGTHRFSVKVMGKNPLGKSGASGGHVFGLDFLRTSK